MANCAASRIKKIYSNPQVFGQCRLWLQQNMPNAELISTSSTTKAAQMAVKEKNAASISSELAAQVYGLNIIKKGIQDSTHNITRFLVLSPSTVPQTGKDRTSVVFAINDKVGALLSVLEPFHSHKINMTKIESRPIKKKAWEYYFFVDLEGHVDNPNVAEALQQLSGMCQFVKVLGSYPVLE
jgi:chorismate mutase/prephenate dehydratase